jgi:CTP-dependent riboflavin kinase
MRLMIHSLHLSFGRDVQLGKNKTYRGFVKTGRGRGVAEMSSGGSLDEFQRLTGLPIIPGTLNLDLSEPFDLALLKYVTFAKLGWTIDLLKSGIEYDGEIGMYYGKALVAGKYPAFVIFFSWVDDLRTDAELVSSYHLRGALNLRDGDIVDFRLITA